VAEIPLDEGLALFTEDRERFYWGRQQADKGAITGVRMLLNGAAVAAAARSGATLPELPPPESHEGRERWEVVLYLQGGGSAVVSCGSLREGVSREIASKVYAAAAAAIALPRA
jgi:hypothetical protein